MILTLKQSFSSAHFYNQPQWSSEENLKHFGKCFSEFGHGHNYVLQVGFHVQASQLTEKKVQYQLLLEQLCYTIDHQHLNFKVPEFKTQIPTTENIALYFKQKLKEQLLENQLSFIRLYETDDLWTEIQI